MPFNNVRYFLDIKAPPPQAAYKKIKLSISDFL